MGLDLDLILDDTFADDAEENPAPAPRVKEGVASDVLAGWDDDIWPDANLIWQPPAIRGFRWNAATLDFSGPALNSHVPTPEVVPPPPSMLLPPIAPQGMFPPMARQAVLPPIVAPAVIPLENNFAAQNDAARDVVRRVENSSEARRFECIPCGARYTTAANAIRHWNESCVQNNAKMKHRCAFRNCNHAHAFASAQSLSVHVNAQHRNVKYRCNECGQENKYSHKITCQCRRGFTAFEDVDQDGGNAN